MYNSNYSRMPNGYIYNNQKKDDRFVGGFLGPFLLGGITGGLLAPSFYPRPIYPPVYSPVVYRPYPGYYYQNNYNIY